MPYRKPYFRKPISKRNIMELDFRAIRMCLNNYQRWIPAGMESRKRYQRAIAFNQNIHDTTNSSDRQWILTEQPRSIPEEMFKAFIALCSQRGFTIYVKGRALNPKVHTTKVWRLENEL